MKIRGCEAFTVALPWRRLHKMAFPGGTLGNYVIVRVFTRRGDAPKAGAAQVGR
jgi:hypothetical protein